MRPLDARHRGSLLVRGVGVTHRDRVAWMDPTATKLRATNLPNYINSSTHSLPTGNAHLCVSSITHGPFYILHI